MSIRTCHAFHNEGPENRAFSAYCSEIQGDFPDFSAEKSLLNSTMIFLLSNLYLLSLFFFRIFYNAYYEKNILGGNYYEYITTLIRF